MNNRVRLTISLPVDIHRQLTTWADLDSRTISNLVSVIVTKAVKEWSEQLILSSELQMKLLKVCQQKKVNVSQVVTQLVEKWLEENQEI